MTNNTTGRDMYLAWTEQQGIHSHLFPKWDDLTPGQRKDWEHEAAAASSASASGEVPATTASASEQVEADLEAADHALGEAGKALAEAGYDNPAESLADSIRAMAAERDRLRSAAITVSAERAAGGEFPPLPEPLCKVGVDLNGNWVEYLSGGGDAVYTADQMREYGKACRAAGTGAGDAAEDAVYRAALLWALYHHQGGSMSLDIEKERYGFERCAKRLGKCSFGRFFDGSYKDARTAELFAVWLSAKNDCETFYRRNAELETENAILRATQPAPIPAQAGTWEPMGPYAQKFVAHTAEPPAVNALTDEAKDAARYRFIRDTSHNGYELRSQRFIGNWHVSRKMREGEGEFFFGERLDSMIDRDIASHIKAGQAGKDE
jgi:hypothetical protein